LRHLGLTIHTGEQLLARTPRSLLSDVEDSLKLGADRLGHALILGTSGEQLVKMGAKMTPEEVISFDKDRVRLLNKVRQLGVVVELNITSNLVISNINLDLHAAAEMARYGIRMSISTDDEALLHTTVVKEMHRFAQQKG